MEQKLIIIRGQESNSQQLLHPLSNLNKSFIFHARCVPHFFSRFMFVHNPSASSLVVKLSNLALMLPNPVCTLLSKVAIATEWRSS